MWIVILHCLENNDKEKSLYVFSTDIFFPKYFYLW
jgi:hypothetical protein